ncbi:TetR/AcrR family transcriptional regulator [Brevundimonas sp. Root1279]|uniref:TetR/AcrR family transcriptional regulator n=1 Tax=Brevundimonas sp. Root1279 TaxID=1736443 RepID=UPI00070018EE|nr:TetR/AcrR family transcriptional regulator [Brevundimonas sp. Root1279]KQW82471.1 TetR family transcriptional regulator [Brevundimonas sp. Root1279]
MDRPLRKDAADRRAALLQAARAVFAEEGIDAPLDHIAERAGVGRATLYRNFPGRTEIALAVLLDDVAELGERFAAPAEPDAFLDFITALSERLVRNTALGGVVRAAPSAEILTPLRAAMIEAATPSLKLSQAAGTVRGDLEASDIRVLASMLGAGLHNAAPDERNAMARRTLELVLDAVRAR